MMIYIFKDLKRRISTSLRAYGIKGTLFKLRAWVSDYLFDFRYGTDTRIFARLNNLTIKGENKEKSNNYEPTKVYPLRKMFKIIKPMLDTQKVLVDFGSGKGRVLLIASEFGFKKVRGVEFARELCIAAENNCALYKAKSKIKTEFEIIETDAATYKIQNDESVFFMFNPFNEKIINVVLENISRSILVHPRKVLIIYHNPLLARFIDSKNTFSRVKEINLTSYNFIIYSN